jgi:hypothetical protein
MQRHREYARLIGVCARISELRSEIENIAPERRSLIRNAADLDTTVTAAAPNANGPRGRGWQMLGWLEDAGLLVVLALAFPLVILILGTPVVFVGWLLLENARRSL